MLELLIEFNYLIHANKHDTDATLYIVTIKFLLK